MKPHSQRGVALVITLIMLAVVTLMAITFLAVSRRERSAVTVTSEQNSSRLMADAALARAKSEAVARMLTQGSLLACDMMVSTNFVSPNGFDPNLPRDTATVTNVNYDHLLGSRVPLLGANWLRNIGNLMLDPRPPVFAVDSTNVDFRFYHDLNRNGRFETNGFQAFLDQNGRPIVQGTNVARGYLVGDPEWIGVLQYPDAPHSATNRFIGRYAYLLLPAGRSLDWNFIHNNAALADRDPELASIGYYRNQGVGSWELNLGGFLHDLNANAWPKYSYVGLGNPAPTEAAFDALEFLRYRYAGRYDSLAPATRWFINTNGASRAAVLRRDFIDTYTDGPPFAGTKALTSDEDRPERAWAGSDNPNSYFELNDLFSTNKTPGLWRQRLTFAQAQRDTYDRYTFYRMLGQIGMDSTPANQNKLNLNYDNLPPYNATNMVPWAVARFFPAVANRLIEASRTTNIVGYSTNFAVTNFHLGEHLVRPTLSVSNIQIYPYNEYSPVLHRLLQLAVNLYDSTTNRPDTKYPYLPTVFRPTFRAMGTNLFISGYVEVTNSSFLTGMVLRDLNNARDRAALATDANPIVFNVPFLVGAKKGFPNFNEFAMQNVAQVTRKAQLVKKLVTDRAPSQTNLMYLLSISNQFGIETWNSYTQDFTRALRVQAGGIYSVMVTNPVPPGTVLGITNITYFVNLTNSLWPAGQFRLPIFRSVTVLSNDAFQPWPQPRFIRSGTNVNFIPNLGFYVPEWDLVVSNRFYYALIDNQSDRVVDFVCLGNLSAQMNLSREIAGRAQAPSASGGASEPPNVWLTNRVAAGVSPQIPTEGVINQLEISLGDVAISEQQWRSWNADAASGRDKEKSIDLLREFCGLTPLVYQSDRERGQLRSELAGKLAYQAAYSPTRKVYQDLSWQVNDPLVHYMLGDLLDPHNRPDDPNRTNSVRFAVPPQRVLTNVNLGVLNERYRPWRGNPNQSTDILAKQMSVKDPLIEKSDDWEFPTNKFPNVGWIGRVHRGTPWQTVYLKADIADTNLNTLGSWYRWAGSLGTHPTNDWNLVEIFTAAPNDNAARGLLSVNQTNLAAWSAALSGISILIPTSSTGAVKEVFLDNLPPTESIRKIVEGINRTRQLETNRVRGGSGAPYFGRLGRILATPELTFVSPTLPIGSDGSLPREFSYPARDEVIERIPQQVLSLLREDEPRFVVYAFGQALKEAPNSLYLGEGAFNRMCTNYQVKSEFVIKSTFRIDGPPTNLRAVVESFNELTTE